jgi:hypothetical protein
MCLCLAWNEEPGVYDGSKVVGVKCGSCGLKGKTGWGDKPKPGAVMHLKANAHGLDEGAFKDSNGAKCSIQCSSSIGDGPRLWLGRDDNIQNHHVTGEPLSPRMHLNVPQVEQLVRLMHHWLATNKLRPQ